MRIIAYWPKMPINREQGVSVTLSDEDYQRLLLAAEADDMIVWCERCGAWLDRDDPRTATSEDIEGCWFSVTLLEEHKNTCVRECRPARQALD